MSDLPFGPSGVDLAARLVRLEARLLDLTREDERLTSRQCEVRLERGDVLNAIIAEGGDEAYSELVARAKLSEQQAGQERWISARIPDYARKAASFSWAAHREVAALEPDQIVAVFDAALATGRPEQCTQRAVREIARAMFGGDPAASIADPLEQDWPGFLRMALIQHFAGRLSDELVGELVTQITRFQSEWERAQEQILGAAA